MVRDSLLILFWTGYAKLYIDDANISSFFFQESMSNVGKQDIYLSSDSISVESCHYFLLWSKQNDALEN